MGGGKEQSEEAVGVGEGRREGRREEEERMWDALLPLFLRIPGIPSLPPSLPLKQRATDRAAAG